MHERILAIDYGRARHGLAASDGLGLTGRPLTALERTGPEPDLAELRRLVADLDIRRLVVGLPLNMDGSEGPMAREARAFAVDLARQLALPLQLEDERLTTVEAEQFLTEARVPRAERHRLRDSVAAAILLRDVLERERSAHP